MELHVKRAVLGLLKDQDWEPLICRLVGFSKYLFGGVRFSSRRPTLLHSPEPHLNQLIQEFCITRNVRYFGATLCMTVALHVTHVAKDIGLLQTPETTLSSIVKLTILLHYFPLNTLFNILFFIPLYWFLLTCYM